jgi:two-component system sensor histidine kinase RpfC
LPPSNALKSAFLGKCRWKGTAEQEQAALRLVISVTFIGVMFFYRLHGTSPSLNHWFVGMAYITGYLLVSAGFLISTLLYPQRSVTRRVMTIFLDVAFMSYGHYLTGGLGAPWYGVYLWVTLGNGFRYGEKYLYLSGALSLVGFSLAVLYSPYWADKRALAVGLAVTLLVVPAYSAVLIRRLNEAKRQADEANRAKSDFLSRMSHEIRTPLNGILGMTELMLLRELTPKERQYLNVIDASGKALARQIDDILDLSKIESGKLALVRSTFDLHKLINQTLNMLSPQADRNQTQLLEDVDPRTPFLLEGDHHRLQQVLVNLINNAIKFTREGTVILRVQPKAQAEGVVRLRMEVQDNGVGIKEEQINNIFEPFTQAHAGISQTYGGTGLGTAICKHLVGLMDGEIGVVSTEGEGSTFWFEVPLALPAGAPDKSWRNRCRVLYVNGTDDQRVPAWLFGAGVSARGVDSLDRARQLVCQAGERNQEWDAVILDRLPYDDAMHELIHGANRCGLNEPLFIVIAMHGYPPAAYKPERPIFVLESDVNNATLNNALHACYIKHSGDRVIHIASAQAGNMRPVRTLNVLIGDDNNTNRLVLEHMVNKLGHKALMREGGEAVLHALERDEFDVVIIDKNMPDMSGIEVYTAYRLHHGGAAPTPFVLLTADATEESRRASERAGFRYFLTKPVSIVTLQATLEEICPARGGEAQSDPEVVEQEAAPAVEQHKETPHIDPTALESMAQCADDPGQFLRDIVTSFRNDVAQDVRNMGSAIFKKNRAAFSDYAHALKGSAAYMGMRRLVQLCEHAQHVSREEFDQRGSALFKEITLEIDAGLEALEEQLLPDTQPDRAAGPGGRH